MKETPRDRLVIEIGPCKENSPHRWRIESPQGPVSSAVCTQGCGKKRDYYTSKTAAEWAQDDLRARDEGLGEIIRRARIEYQILDLPYEYT